MRAEAATGNQESVNGLLLIRKDRINVFGLPSMRTALHQAALNGHDAVCLLLIAAQANLMHQDKEGNTALHLAIQKKYFETAKLLVQYGADISCRNKAGSKNALDLLNELKEFAVRDELIALRRTFEARNVVECEEPFRALSFQKI